MGSLTPRLLGVVEGWYRPRDAGEASELATVARMNKLYLPFLRAVRDLLYNEFVREERRYRWFIRNTLEVAESLMGLRYAFYKFRRPVDHVSVDLDILIDSRHVSKAVSRLTSRGFEIAVAEPYTVTMRRGGFIVDLYTHPSFAWVVYMDGEEVLRSYVEEFEYHGANVSGITREAEVAVGTAHAIYKEHFALLMDCLALWKWGNRKALDIASELGVYDSIKILSSACHEVLNGVEAPVKIHPASLFKAYLRKAFEDPLFRATSPNIIRYIIERSDSGGMVLHRLTRRGY